MIFQVLELSTQALSLREICRKLDLVGCRRPGGKPRRGAHGLVRSILLRKGQRACRRGAAVQRRIEAVKAEALDCYRPRTISDAEAAAHVRGGR